MFSPHVLNRRMHTLCKSGKNAGVFRKQAEKLACFLCFCTGTVFAEWTDIWQGMLFALLLSPDTGKRP